jgi:4-hydroxy-tetrahydrodipicolinate reductase
MLSHRGADMRIAIVGYGKMGRLIKSTAEASGIEVPVVIDPISKDPGVTATDVCEQNLSDVQAVVEFSTPSVVVDHLKVYTRMGLDAVIGTTGWTDKLPQVRQMVETSSSSVIYSGNYSLGVAVFLKLVRQAAAMLGKAGGYDSGVFEMHHAAKADSPSGTALMLAQSLTDAGAGKDKIVSETLHRTREADEVQVASLRVGSVFGTHTVYFDSDADTIELTHRAKNRQGFAQGAITAVTWLVGQKPGLYTLDDLISHIM